MSNFFRHCKLTKGQTSEIAWIPERFAIKGKFIKVLGEDGWQVVEVGKSRIEGSYLMEHERNYLTQRRASDI